jgi:hypothetical protein
MLPSEFEDLKVAIIPAIIGLMGSVDATCVHVVDGDGVFFHVCVLCGGGGFLTDTIIL